MLVRHATPKVKGISFRSLSIGPVVEHVGLSSMYGLAVETSGTFPFLSPRSPCNKGLRLARPRMQTYLTFQNLDVSKRCKQSEKQREDHDACDGKVREGRISGEEK